MSQLTVEIDDYLTEDDKRELVKDAFRDEVRSKIRSEYDMNTFINNLSYANVVEQVNKVVPNYEDKLRDKVAEVVDGLTSYTVFYKGSSIYGKEESSVGNEMIGELVKENRDVLNTKVLAIIEDLDNYDIGQMISETINETLQEAFSKKEK